jgi:anthranilate phosphoribosyltransferase
MSHKGRDRFWRFYERLGFRSVANYLEPVTNRDYVVMRRDV